MIQQVRFKRLVAAKEPCTQTELCSFVAFVKVGKRFTPNFTNIAAPLNALLRKGQPPKLKVFTPEQMGAFQSLLKGTTTALILAGPQKRLHYSVTTDLSEYQVGCPLFRTIPDGERRHIGYWS